MPRSVQVVLLIFALLFAVFLVKGARAHSAPSGMEYSALCCDGIDCAPIPTQAVKITPQGYLVTLREEQHPMLTGPYSILVPFASAKESTDGAYHICILRGAQDTFQCFYAPPLGF